MTLESVGTPVLWIGFTAFVVAMLVLDLSVFHRRAHEVRMREALLWTGVWIGMALLFNLGVYLGFGARTGLEFLTGYLIEKALSVDNLFVFLVIFAYFRVPGALQHRVLFWGILGALVTRAIFILLGAALLHRFHWVVYIFGGFLVFTGIKLLFQGESEVHPEHNPVLRLFARLVPTVSDYRGTRFSVVEAGRRYATPLLMVLVVVETTDVVFAVDSIPAIFAVTRDPFIVYTSNIFAILGLRALFFVLAGTMNQFHYLQVGLGLVLAFVGVKMLIADVYKVPVGISLGVIATLLAGSMIASLLRPPEAPPLPHPADHTDPVPRSTESDRC
jgi:tellurite resistance protein TerC